MNGLSDNASELKLNYIVYFFNIPIYLFLYVFLDKRSEFSEERITDASALSHLQDFMYRGNRYKELNFFKNYKAGQSSLSNKRVLLIKDLSAFFSYDPQQWYDMLR